MKVGILTLLLLTSISCSIKQLDPKLIIGSWKMKDIVNNTGLNATDKLTFYKNDSVYVEILVDNEINSQFKGKYNLDTESKTLITSFNGQISSRSEVIKLTESEMELKDKKTGRLIRYIRF